MAALRAELLADLTGEVVEVGAGNGMNFAHYPQAGGCHTATDPVAAITAGGFEVTESRRLRFPEGRFTQPSSPHVLGTARLG